VVSGSRSAERSDRGIVDFTRDNVGDYAYGSARRFIGIGEENGDGSNLALLTPVSLSGTARTKVKNAEKVVLRLRTTGRQGDPGTVSVWGLNTPTRSPRPAGFSASATQLSSNTFPTAFRTVEIDVTDYAKAVANTGRRSLMFRVQLDSGADLDGQISKVKVGTANARNRAARPTLIFS
jgi:hypothetical protein